jgi:hypothetical protein
MQPLNFLRRIDRTADHLDGRSYFLLGRQPSPGQHSLLQGGAISRDARASVQGRWSASIGVAQIKAVLAAVDGRRYPKRDRVMVLLSIRAGLRTSVSTFAC